MEGAKTVRSSEEGRSKNGCAEVIGNSPALEFVLAEVEVIGKPSLASSSPPQAAGAGSEGDNTLGAAAKLGMARSTLESKIRSLKINKNHFKT